MLFNSLEYLIFFPVVVIFYFNIPHRFRWAFLLGASYYFYMAWIPAYAILIIFSTLVDFTAGKKIASAQTKYTKKFWLGCSLLTNFGLLFSFKYYDFFVETLQWVSLYLPLQIPIPPYMELLLPVGISFYTFQTVSYSIDVYRGRQKAEKHLGYFALYVSFFPQLIAGPIERPGNLLPQLSQKHDFNYSWAVSGIKLMAWGMFKKVVIADRLAVIVDPVFTDPTSFSGPVLMFATICFAIQIYCDFSGYSDIAIGTARVMGIKLMRNFNQPYLATSVVDFWKRWHISLSSWFRDYVYLPLGGNRVSVPRWYLNLLIVFLVSGLWHGANMTFIVWGFLHGMYFVSHHILKPLFDRAIKTFQLNKLPALLQFIQILVTFSLVCLAWVFFRASNISDALYIISHFGTGWMSVLDIEGIKLIAHGLFGHEDYYFIAQVVALWSLLVVGMVLIEQHEYYLRLFETWPLIVRWPAYWLLLLIIFALGSFGKSAFIYFQF